MVSNGFFDISCCYLATPFHRNIELRNYVWVFFFLWFWVLCIAPVFELSSISSKNNVHVFVSVFCANTFCRASTSHTIAYDCVGVVDLSLYLYASEYIVVEYVSGCMCKCVLCGLVGLSVCVYPYRRCGNSIQL